MERPEPLRTLEVWAIALRPPKAVREQDPTGGFQREKAIRCPEYRW